MAVPNKLPRQALQPLLALASRSDVLLFGEVHGTQEVPQLMAGLLDEMAPMGYRGLALEVSANQRDELAKWAQQKVAEPPPFFARPNIDGRGNKQVLDLVGEAVRKEWQVLCFDLEPSQPFRWWSQRDADMARNFTAQRDRLCPARKVLGVCGGFHSRLTRPSGNFTDLWPSFAFSLQRLNPGAVISTIAVVFHQGGFYNGGKVHHFISGEPVAEAELREDKEWGHSLMLHLPTATPATFLAPPKA